MTLTRRALEVVRATKDAGAETRQRSFSKLQRHRNGALGLAALPTFLQR
jgi:hypothetical protein